MPCLALSDPLVNVAVGLCESPSKMAGGWSFPPRAACGFEHPRGVSCQEHRVRPSPDSAYSVTGAKTSGSPLSRGL